MSIRCHGFMFDNLEDNAAESTFQYHLLKLLDLILDMVTLLTPKNDAM